MRLQLQDAVALVTGAASGIGRSTALLLARRGCHLALVDRQEELLERVASDAEAEGVRVSRHLLDLLDPAAIETLQEEVLASHDRVTILINNAGVSLVGSFQEVTVEEFRWLMEINFFAVLEITKAFLPTLLAQPQAQIANVSSIFGIIAPAGQTAYSASKFAVRGFSEALRHELEGSSVGVTVVHPGGVRTAIATSARVAALADPKLAAEATERFTREALRLAPEEAAAMIVRAVERRQERLLIGRDARSVDLLQRLAPARYWAMLRRQFERPPEGEP